MQQLHLKVRGVLGAQVKSPGHDGADGDMYSIYTRHGEFYLLAWIPPLIRLQGTRHASLFRQGTSFRRSAPSRH